MPPRVLAVVTNHDRFDHISKPTGLWLGELSHFLEVLEPAGVTVEVASPQGGKVPIDPDSLKLRGMARKANERLLGDPRGRAMLQSSLRLADVDAERYDAVYFAGGHGAMWDFPLDVALRRIAEFLHASGRMVAAVCHGVSALLELTTPNGQPLVAGRRVTGYANVEEVAVGHTRHVPFSLQDELKRRGAEYHKALVPFFPHLEIDDRLVTGQNPYSTAAVARALLARLPMQRAADEQATVCS
jgi:putative intracellular protease/amidase